MHSCDAKVSKEFFVSDFDNFMIIVGKFSCGNFGKVFSLGTFFYFNIFAHFTNGNIIKNTSKNKSIVLKLLNVHNSSK